ncbi:MAG: pyridoxal phosphate-dependent aminotransferase [Rhizobiales bacterium]|nr:pyridoxal phosphate-dependent aminotransferase [Hyphomicrobiales bacterium]
MSFDKVINRVGTHTAKWDTMESNFGVSPSEGISMWIADMDFAPPLSVTKSIENMLKNQVLGYYGDDKSYKSAIIGWMKHRHNWTVDPNWIFTVHGLVNGVALCIQTYTEENDGIIIFTPVYHQFAKTILANNRKIVESNLVNNDGRFEMDLNALETSLTGDETMMVFCSPHNPCGRVWTKDELQQVLEFCKKHDLILVSDEIHHDLVFGDNKHTIMSLISPLDTDLIIILSAATKSFNIAGCLTGNVIIQDENLRKQFANTLAANAIGGHAFGHNMCEAAYKDGEEWLNTCVDYIAENCRVFDEIVNQIPGVTSIKLESTYLAWVDFSKTGMSRSEIVKRVGKTAKIAASPGSQFGKVGELFMRFNLACSRSVVIEAANRLKTAFSDLQ